MVPHLQVALWDVVVVRVVDVVPAFRTWFWVGVVMFAVSSGAMVKVLAAVAVMLLIVSPPEP